MVDFHFHSLKDILLEYRKNNVLRLQKEIESAINRYSLESGSDTPDFILAEYLTDCLKTFNKAVCAREKWYSRECGSENQNLNQPTPPPPPAYPTCHHCKGRMTHTMLESWCEACGFISTMNGCGWPHEGDEGDLRDSPPSTAPHEKAKVLMEHCPLLPEPDDLGQVAKDTVTCENCGYSGSIGTYLPSLIAMADCVCPRCRSTYNEHNAKYAAQIHKALNCKHAGTLCDGGMTAGGKPLLKCSECGSMGLDWAMLGNQDPSTLQGDDTPGGKS